MAIHSSIFALRIPCAEEPSGLKSLGSQKVRHYWSNWALKHIQCFVSGEWLAFSMLVSTLFAIRKKKVILKSVFKLDLPCLPFLVTFFLLALRKEPKDQMWCLHPQKQAGQKCKEKWESSSPEIISPLASAFPSFCMPLNFYLQEMLRRGGPI